MSIVQKIQNISEQKDNYVLDESEISKREKYGFCIVGKGIRKPG